MKNFILKKKESKALASGATITRERGNYVYTIKNNPDNVDTPLISVNLKSDTKIVIRDSHTFTLHFENARLAKQGLTPTQDFDGEKVVISYDKDTQEYTITPLNEYRVITQ